MVDVLVIGAGGAGLVAALSAKEAGASVQVITKTYPTRSQTCMAQGGINAALANVSEDSIQSHFENTLKSAHGIGDEKMIQKLCSEAPDALHWLNSIGVPFSRTEDGKIAQRRLGGASAPRACYAQDYTGLKILHTLYDQCNANDIDVLVEHFLLDLIVEDNRVYGASILDIKSGEVKNIYAKSVVLATGGYSRIYGKNSTNAFGSTGDGVAAAFRAGAGVSDMEFVQFHPTALKNSSILISESARGDGGYLLNKDGERFTNELAPRDEVSRAIYDELQNGGEVFIDIRHLGEEFIEHNLPQERKLAMQYEGLDPVFQIVSIKPAAHYTMGGIDVNYDSKSTLDGLYAAGECANQKVHGANRLGGNSLLELIIFGRQAGINAAKYAAQNSLTYKEFSVQDLQQFIKSDCSEDFYAQKEELGEVFYLYAGIKRSEKELQNLKEKMLKLKNCFSQFGVRDGSKIYNTELVEFLEFKNMLEVSELVLEAALARTESRGAHFRVDMTSEDKEFKKNNLYFKNGDQICLA
jgi:succinate dehydrogenase/fumarate reductase flavoprotein subunit